MQYKYLLVSPHNGRRQQYSHLSGQYQTQHTETLPQATQLQICPNMCLLSQATPGRRDYYSFFCHLTPAFAQNLINKTMVTLL